VLLIGIPITLRVYFNAGITYMLMKCWKSSIPLRHPER
jgi:hypothetical protein